MYCDQCGTLAQPSHVFCRTCGVKLQREPALMALPSVERAEVERVRRAAARTLNLPAVRPTSNGFLVAMPAPLRVDTGIAAFDNVEARLIRRPFTVALLTLATFGLYFIVWYYFVRRFAETRLGRPNHAAIYTVLLLVPVVNIITALMTMDVVARAVDVRGSKRALFAGGTVIYFVLLAFAALPYPWWALVFLTFVPVMFMHAEVVRVIIAGRVINKRRLHISALQTALAAAGLLLVFLAGANLIIGATPLGYIVSLSTLTGVILGLRTSATMRAWQAVERPSPVNRFAAATA